MNPDIQTLFLPQYKNLSVERIMEFISDYGEIDHYLPDELDMAKIPKYWLVNVCVTIIG